MVIWSYQVYGMPHIIFIHIKVMHILDLDFHRSFFYSLLRVGVYTISGEI